LVGIDFIIEDISKSWKEQARCGVIECNSRPFFDNHHLPFNGKPRNVAGAIWDYAGF
jgi:cyanophycin synthetase